MFGSFTGLTAGIPLHRELGFSDEDPLLRTDEMKELSEGHPFRRQILMNSKRFREATGFAPGNHKIVLNYETVETDDGLVINRYLIHFEIII